jgi:hypothetical protein
MNQRELMRGGLVWLAHALQRLAGVEARTSGAPAAGEGSRVGDLLPLHCDAPADVTRAGDIRAAMRAWVSRFNRCPVVFTHPKDLCDSSAKLTPDQLHDCLCEYLQRATLETLFTIYFDGEDVHTDIDVCATIRDFFGQQALQKVLAEVAASGVLVKRATQPKPRQVTQAFAATERAPTSLEDQSRAPESH